MKILEAPMYINWNYTYKCNFSCNHCYSRLMINIKELPTKKYLKIAEEIVSSQVFQVNLGGGEPLLRNDCFKIIKYLTQKGVKVNLTTNGWLINEETIQKLKGSGLHTLLVSLDHIVPKEHNKFRNKKGSHKKVLECIELAKKNDMRVFFSTVITLKNFDVIEDIVKFAEEKNIDGIDFKRFRPQGKGLLNKDKYTIPKNREKDLLKKMLKIIKHPKLKIFFLFSENGISGIDEGCPCGRISIGLLPNGDLTPCVYNQVIVGNILKDSLKNIWQGSPFLKRFRENFHCIAEVYEHEN